MTDASIRISSEARDRLKAMKQGGESYEDLIIKLAYESSRTVPSVEEARELLADPEEAVSGG